MFAVALVVDLLAPKFGGQRSYSSALRLTAYSFTPVWLAGIFLLVPGASFLVLLGLYGFYLMWIGMPVLMQSPTDKTVPYVAASRLCVALERVHRADQTIARELMSHSHARAYRGLHGLIVN